MTTLFKLWLDDARTPPDDTWTWVQTAEEALEILKTGNVTRASLDHDLECPVDRSTLNDLVPKSSYFAHRANGEWLAEQMVKFRAFPSEDCILHSANKDAARRMAMILKDHVRVHICPARAPLYTQSSFK